MGTIVLGKIEAGSLRKNQVLTLMPNRVRTTHTCPSSHTRVQSSNLQDFYRIILFFVQMQTEVLMLWCDDEEADEALSGANIKLKLKNVEEEVSCCHLLSYLAVKPSASAKTLSFIWGYLATLFS